MNPARDHPECTGSLGQTDVVESASATEPSVSRPGALRAPPLGRHHVLRGRIDALLEDAIDASLVLVSAPAGAGKSTALSGWLARRNGGGRWYSLDGEDNDPAVSGRRWPRRSGWPARPL